MSYQNESSDNYTRKINALIVGTGESSNCLYSEFDWFPTNFYKNGRVVNHVILLLKKYVYSIQSMTLRELGEFNKHYDECYINAMLDKYIFIDFLEWIQDNVHLDILYYKSDDVNNEYPTISRFDVPDKFQSVFEYQTDTDLSTFNNRVDMFRVIQTLFQDTTHIDYTTLDMYKLKTYTDEHIKENERVCNELSLNQITLKNHIYMDFLDFIKQNSYKYDIIYFFGCTHPSFVLDDSLSYKTNLKKSLHSNGKIVYSDGWSDNTDDSGKIYKNKTSVFGFKECSKIVNDNIDMVTRTVDTIFTKKRPLKSSNSNIFYYIIE
uniref:Uncharacterized protein n=1 Tax=Megaviridae environmental sample TaxID=1737588 RepID=A0A5J6VKK0_9VIRU|nr:MAG: hypothetical protein [Megaviridae environmental sample]